MIRLSLLSVQNLKIDYVTNSGRFRALDGISFQLNRGKTLGLVGESGSGKSTTALAIMKLLRAPAVLREGSITCEHRKAMIFQEPMTALNPVFTCGAQISEALRLHNPKMSREEVQEQAILMLRKVRIHAPEQRFHEYPHQLSGGMRQRVMIAMAICCQPDLLIADEPTSALDVTVQAQILELLNELKTELGSSLLFITHDLGIVAENCDEVAIMQAGRIVEQGTASEVFQHPQHAYTKTLLEDSLLRPRHQRRGLS